MQMRDQAQAIILSTRKDNSNVIFINRQEEKLYKEQLAAKFPIKGVQPLIVMETL